MPTAIKQLLPTAKPSILSSCVAGESANKIRLQFFENLLSVYHCDFKNAQLNTFRFFCCILVGNRVVFERDGSRGIAYKNFFLDLVAVKDNLGNLLVPCYCENVIGIKTQVLKLAGISWSSLSIRLFNRQR